MGEGIYSRRPEQRPSKQNRSNGSAGKGPNEVFLNPQFVVQNSRDVNSSQSGSHSFTTPADNLYLYLGLTIHRVPWSVVALILNACDHFLTCRRKQRQPGMMTHTQLVGPKLFEGALKGILNSCVRWLNLCASTK